MASFEWWWRSHASFSFSIDDAVVVEPVDIKTTTYFSPNATILTRLWNCNPRWQLLFCLGIAYFVAPLIVWPDFLHDIIEAPPSAWYCSLSNDTFLEFSNLINGTDSKSCLDKKEQCKNWTFEFPSSPGAMQSSIQSHLRFTCQRDIRRCEIAFQSGSLAGSLLLTMIADRRGRKFTTLFFSAVATGLALLLGLTISGNHRYVVVNIFFGLFRQVPALTGLVWAVEFIPPTRRSVLAIGMHTCVVIHWIFLGLLALAIRHWEPLHYVATLFPLPGLFLLSYLSNESLGFLIAKNKYKSVKKIIRKRADKVNRTKFPLAEIESLQMRADATAHYLDDEEELFGGSPYLSALGKQYNLYDLFHSPRLFSWTLISLLLWCLIALLDHVSRLALPYSSMNAIHDFLLRGACQLPAYLGGALLMFAFSGRSKLLLSCHLLTLIPIFIALSWSPLISSVKTCLAFIAFTLVAFCKATLVLLCIEVYPTSMRCLGLGVNCAIGQLISIVCYTSATSLTLNLGIISGCIIIPCLILFWCFFPDTRLRPLPESLYEIEHWKMPAASSVCRCLWNFFRAKEVSSYIDEDMN